MAVKANSFGRESRIRKRAEFDAVFGAKRRASCRELLIYVFPAERMRLGISMTRRVGIAARRNKIKRLIREAFRLSRGEWQGKWDIVVVPRPHEPMRLEEYRMKLGKLLAEVVEREKT